MRKLRNIGKMCYPNDNNRDLLDRFSKEDKTDIEMLVNNYDINLDEFMPYLSDRAKENYNSIIKGI